MVTEAVASHEVSIIYKSSLPSKNRRSQDPLQIYQLELQLISLYASLSTYKSIWLVYPPMSDHTLVPLQYTFPLTLQPSGYTIELISFVQLMLVQLISFLLASKVNLLTFL